MPCMEAVKEHLSCLLPLERFAPLALCQHCIWQYGNAVEMEVMLLEARLNA